MAGRIILATGDGVGTVEIMRRTGKSKPCVWRWQERFTTEGVEGLLRDKTRPSRIPRLGPAVSERVVALTLTDPPGETTHWTAAMMAEACGISPSAVRRIWHAHGLQPHRYRQFKLSNDPKFVDKLRDVVGLYIDPPAHAIVLSVDEKSQIQALDRTQPGLPMKKGRLGTMTHMWTALSAGTKPATNSGTKSATDSDLKSATFVVAMLDRWSGSGLLLVVRTTAGGAQCQLRECRCDAYARSCASSTNAVPATVRSPGPWGWPAARLR